MALNKPCILLTIISGMERFAFKGVASNLVTYLTDVMEMRNSSAAKFVNNWVGVTSMLPLIVATLADSYCDRYSTILASSLLYASGLLALTSTAVGWPWIPRNNVHNSISSLSWSLYIISIGQGGYNPSLQAFGADQLDCLDDNLPRTCTDQEKSPNKKRVFFQWWYFGVCCGSLLGVSVMSYIQDTFGWGLGFAIPTLSMVASILMFLGGSRLFVHKHNNSVDDGKSFEDVVRAIKASFSKMINGGNAHEYSKVELELQEKCNEDEDEMFDTTSGRETKGEERQHFVEAMRIVLGLLPVWLMLLMFAVIFQQPATFFTKQGMTMRRNIGSKFKVPPAALQSAITLSIIILMPCYDVCFLPLFRHFTKDHRGISVMQRMGIGMFLSVIAMIIAALVEERRLHMSRNSKGLSEDVALSIFWLLPQYILMGISDIFTVVGMQEFFYSEVPLRMRTMGIALYTSVFGVGSFLSAILISTIEYLTTSAGGQGNWFSDDMTQARLDKYYWFLALSSAVSLLAFIAFCRFFKRDR